MKDVSMEKRYSFDFYRKLEFFMCLRSMLDDITTDRDFIDEEKWLDFCYDNFDNMYNNLKRFRKFHVQESMINKSDVDKRFREALRKAKESLNE